MLVKDDNLRVLSFYLSFCFVSRHYSPLCVVEQDKHAGAAVILETLIVMPVCVPNEIIKYGRVNDVQQPRPCIIWRHFLHRVAVTLVVLPPARLTRTQIHWIHMFTDVIFPYSTSGIFTVSFQHSPCTQQRRLGPLWSKPNMFCFFSINRIVWWIDE